MAQVQHIAPEAIEAESFRIIEAELGAHSFSAQQFPLVRRVIHATADFSFAEHLRFHPKAVDAGLAAIRAGKHILVDVNMALSGVSQALLQPFGGQALCLVAEEETATLAKVRGLTRSEAAMERGLNSQVGIVAVGNAPTALIKVMAMIDEGRVAPDLVIGAPVGFVNAAESKELLLQKTYPFITSLGRKGGTPVAVALINALLRLA